MGNRITRTIILLCFTVSCCTFMYRAWLALSEHRQLEYGEGPIVDQVARLARGENIYRPDLSQPPFVISNYPPVFHLMQLPLRQLTGPSFLPGRLVSFIATLLTAWSIWALAHRWGASIWSSLIGIAFFLSSPFVVEWGVLNRVDSLALCFATFVLLCLQRVQTQPTRMAHLAALLSALAILTRQTYLVSLVPFGVWYLYTYHGRLHALRYLTVTITTAGIALLGLLLWSSGGAWLHLVVANANQLSFDRLATSLSRAIIISPVLLLIPLLLTIHGIVSPPRRDNSSIRFVIALVLAGFIPVLFVAKVGSSVNYLLEFAFATSLAFALSARVLARTPRMMRSLLVILALQLALHLRFIIGVGLLDPQILERTGFAKIWDKLLTTTGPILTDEFMGSLPMSNRAIVYQPFEMMQMTQQNLWNPAPLLEAINRHQFDAVAVRVRPQQLFKERWGKELWHAVEGQYSVDFQASSQWFLILTPSLASLNGDDSK